MRKIHNLLFFTLFFVFVNCSNNSSTEETSMDVYSTFLCNGQQLGASKTISLSDVTNWSVTTQSTKDQISLGFTSPSDGQTYSGFFINTATGSHLHTGINTNCKLNLMNGNNLYSCSSLTVNITHLATEINDYTEGTFSGNVTLTCTSPFSSNDYQASGSFKVPSK